MKIRKATLKDLKAIQGLNLKLFEKEKKEYDSTLDLKWTLSKTGTTYYKKCISSKNDCAFVVESDGELIGYLVGGIIENYDYRLGKKTSELSNMFVLKKYRGKGIGSKLVKEFLKWSKKKKADNIKVEVSTQNRKGVKFYKKKGFKDYTLVLEINKNNKVKK